jgi:hypothetical protein
MSRLVREASFVVAVFSLVMAAPAAAKNFPVVGGQGPHSIVVGCTAGEYMIGFKGRIGSWIDRIGPVCAPLLPSMELGEKHYPATYGGNGGGPVEATCEPGEVLQGISADRWSNDPNTIHAVHFLCRSAKNGNQSWKGEAGGPGGFYSSWSKEDNYAFVLMQTCPADEWACAIAIRYGQYVNALGLMCRKPDLPTAAPSPKPEQAGTPPPPPVDLTSFTGVWDTVTSAGGGFTLILDVKGNTVTGTFGHADPKFDGTLQGDMDVGGRKFGYSYVQPKIGGSGKGIFTLTPDGKTISGDFVTDQDTTQRFKWTGKRRE